MKHFNLARSCHAGVGEDMTQAQMSNTQRLEQDKHVMCSRLVDPRRADINSPNGAPLRLWSRTSHGWAIVPCRRWSDGLSVAIGEPFLPSLVVTPHNLIFLPFKTFLLVNFFSNSLCSCRVQKRRVSRQKLNDSSKHIYVTSQLHPTAFPFLHTQFTPSPCPTPSLHTLSMSPSTSPAPCLTIFPSAFPQPPWGEALLTLSPRLPASPRASRAAHFMAGHTPGLRRQHRQHPLAGHLPHPHAIRGSRGLTCLERVQDRK